jgi:hypothetical protein
MKLQVIWETELYCGVCRTWHITTGEARPPYACVHRYDVPESETHVHPITREVLIRAD